MSKTPRTDKNKFTAKIKACKLKTGGSLMCDADIVMAYFAEELETELADARAEIDALKTEIRDNNNLAARQIIPAEMAAEDGQLEIQNMSIQIERKDKLIEQMREALKFVYRYKVGMSFNETPDGIEVSRIICAALSAAERGGR